MSTAPASRGRRKPKSNREILAILSQIERDLRSHFDGRSINNKRTVIERAIIDCFFIAWHADENTYPLCSRKIYQAVEIIRDDRTTIAIVAEHWFGLTTWLRKRRRRYKPAL